VLEISRSNCIPSFPPDTFASATGSYRGSFPGPNAGWPSAMRLRVSFTVVLNPPAAFKNAGPTSDRISSESTCAVTWAMPLAGSATYSGIGDIVPPSTSCSIFVPVFKNRAPPMALNSGFGMTWNPLPAGTSISGPSSPTTAVCPGISGPPDARYLNMFGILVPAGTIVPAAVTGSITS